MPLTLMDVGVETTVKTIRGKDQTRKFLQNLGFVEGAKVTVVSSLAGNVIVNVKDGASQSPSRWLRALWFNCKGGKRK